MIPFGVFLGLAVVFFGMSQALEMIVNARRNAAVTMVMYDEPQHSTSWYVPGKED